MRNRTCTDFKRRAMRADAMEAWAKDERASEDARERLQQLAKLKRKKCSSWTASERGLAEVALKLADDVERIVSRGGCTRKAALVPRDWGVLPKKCGLPPRLRQVGKAAALELADGKWTRVSPEDAARIHFPLRTTQGYASYQDGRKTRLLHRELKGGDGLKGLYVDHVNRDRLDNRRENLRVVTGTENNLNRGGVFARKKRGR